MPISENQLITWSHIGAVQSSATTYNSIKTCIDGINWNKDISYEIYLQGSYKNSTNIRGNSDVDVIVEFTNVFYSNKLKLPVDQLKEYNEYFSPGKYELDDFKKAVLNVLVNYYGADNVEEGNKSIKVKGTSGRLNADVICCVEYREYSSFHKTNTNDFIKGITFWQVDNNQQIRNFPKQHYDSGISKNKNSGLKYKSTTRIIKNMRAKLVETNIISSDLAPSYYIESLLFNVPSNSFNQASYQDILGIVLHNLATQSDTGNLSTFLCQNKCRYLFKGSDPHWNEDDCKTFLLNLITLYNEG